MAGVPAIMQAMMDEVVKMLPASAPVLSETIEAGRGEGDIAVPAADVQKAFPAVRIGSYPYHDGTAVHDAAGAALARRGGARRGEGGDGGGAGGCQPLGACAQIASRIAAGSMRLRKSGSTKLALIRPSGATT